MPENTKNSRPELVEIVLEKIEQLIYECLRNARC